MVDLAPGLGAVLAVLGDGPVIVVGPGLVVVVEGRLPQVAGAVHHPLGADRLGYGAGGGAVGVGGVRPSRVVVVIVPLRAAFGVAVELPQIGQALAGILGQPGVVVEAGVAFGAAQRRGVVAGQRHGVRPGRAIFAVEIDIRPKLVLDDLHHAAGIAGRPVVLVPHAGGHDLRGRAVVLVEPVGLGPPAAVVEAADAAGFAGRVAVGDRDVLARHELRHAAAVGDGVDVDVVAERHRPAQAAVLIGHGIPIQGLADDVAFAVAADVHPDIGDIQLVRAGNYDVALALVLRRELRRLDLHASTSSSSAILSCTVATL